LRNVKESTNNYLAVAKPLYLKLKHVTF
jgi:hypothetical protein